MFEEAQITGDFSVDGTTIDGATFSGAVNADTLGTLVEIELAKEPPDSGGDPHGR